MIQAAVCYRFGKPLVIEDVHIDPPSRGEVLVRIAATSICHSDLHVIRGEWGGPVPIVAGHESAGVVEEIGEGVNGVSVGNRVVVSLIRSCGRCHYCARGMPQMCEGEFALAHETRLRNARGDALVQGLFTGGFAEQVVVDQSQVVRIPDAMPLDCAALLACGVITGIGAVVNTAGIEPGSSVAVVGAGGVGLNAIQGARLAGGNPVVAVDLLDSKLAIARCFGATETVNCKEEDAAEAVFRLTSGRGADYVFVTVGSVGAINSAIDLAGRRGTVVLVGIPAADASPTFSAMPFVRSEKRMLGSRMGSARLAVDIPRLVDLYQRGRIKLDELISERYSLEQINEAIEGLERGDALRNVIIF